MLLNLYRRHFRTAGKCTGEHAPDSRSYESDERARRWKLCRCPIYACGTLNGTFHRKNTKEATWEAARAVAAGWEESGTWKPAPEPTRVPLSIQSSEAPGDPIAITITQAIDAYLANRQGRNIAPATFRKYRTMANQFLSFAQHRGYVLLEQFTIADMDLFYASWKDGVRARGKKLERLKGFFKFCVKRKWIPDNVAEELEAPVGAGSAAHRIPFTDQELTKIYEACDRLPATEWSNGSKSGVWVGDDVKTLIMLLCWTGLRISDAATFDMSRVARNAEGGADIFLRMHKTKGALFTWIDDWLYERLKRREKIHGSRIFTCGASTRVDTATDLWRRKINKVFALAGPFECGSPTPHIFRHTFVRLLLQRGVSPRDVAELIGDTEDVVLKHYARWGARASTAINEHIAREALDSAKAETHGDWSKRGPFEVGCKRCENERDRLAGRLPPTQVQRVDLVNSQHP